MKYDVRTELCARSSKSTHLAGGVWRCALPFRSGKPSETTIMVAAHLMIVSFACASRLRPLGRPGSRD